LRIELAQALSWLKKAAIAGGFIYTNALASAGPTFGAAKNARSPICSFTLLTM
jgi:hypothetical protein